MATGPGKYDNACTVVRGMTGAACAIVVVINGFDGDGFSVQGTPATLGTIPFLLRHMADQIEADLKT